MVITQTTANFLITTLTLIFSYTIIVTLSNYMHAWFAHKMGDDTPIQHGYLSLNPLDQIDPVGLMCVILFHLGWGQYIPINPNNLYGRWYKIKMTTVFLAGSFVHILLAFVALVGLVLLLGPSIIPVTQSMIAHSSLSYHILTHVYVAHASYTLALAFILLGIMYFGVVLGVLNGIVNSFYLGVALTYRKAPHLVAHTSDITFFLVPVLLILFLSGPLRIIVVYALLYSGYLITSLLGLS